MNGRQDNDRFKSLTSGFTVFEKSGEILFSPLSREILPNDQLKILEVYSTESKVFYVNSDKASPGLIWDWRWLDIVERFVKIYFILSYHKNYDDKIRFESARYKLEKLVCQYIIEKLHPQNEIWIRSRNPSNLETLLSNHYYEYCNFLSNPYLHEINFHLDYDSELQFAMRSIIGLTLDHEVFHFTEQHSTEGRKTFIDIIENSFFEYFTRMGDTFTVNPYGIHPWKYFVAVETGGSKDMAIELLRSENFKIRDEVYADLVSTGATIALATELPFADGSFKDQNLKGQAKLMSLTYEHIMLWQISLMFFAGINREIEIIAGNSTEMESFSDTDIGARKYLVDLFAWWMILGLFKDEDAKDPYQLKNKRFWVVNEAVNKHERGIQNFMSLLSFIGLNVSGFLKLLADSKNAQPKRKIPTSDEILEITYFPFK